MNITNILLKINLLKCHIHIRCEVTNSLQHIKYSSSEMDKGWSYFLCAVVEEGGQI